MISFGECQAALNVIRRCNITLLGYGELGAAHALCIRDSGVDLRIGLPLRHPDWNLAEAEGLLVMESYEACEEADLIVVLAGPAEQQNYYEQAIKDNLVRHDALIFVDGFGLRYGLISPPADVDIALVQPMASGPRLRREFAEGRGVPTLLAVGNDASNRAWDLALGYASALGSNRAAIVETTIAEAVDAQAFGAGIVAASGITALMQQAYEALIAAGYGHDVAYLACMHQAGEIAENITHTGILGMRSELDPWLGYLSTHSVIGKETATLLNTNLDALCSGQRAAEFVADHHLGDVAATHCDEQILHHPSHETGEKLRSAMPWLRQQRTEDRRWR